jgi:hypothetical protein
VQIKGCTIFHCIFHAGLAEGVVKKSEEELLTAKHSCSDIKKQLDTIHTNARATMGPIQLALEDNQKLLGVDKQHYFCG